MSNRYLNIEGSDRLNNCFTNGRTVVSLDEVKHMMRDIFYANEDPNDIRVDPKKMKLVQADIDKTLSRWENGLQEPTSEERLNDIIEQNHTAHEDYINSLHPDNVTDELIEQLQADLDFRNGWAIKSHNDYLDRMQTDEEREDSQFKRKVKRRKNDNLDVKSDY